MTDTMTRKAPEPRNGVNTPALFATIGAVKQQPTLARFVWKAQGAWMGGTHSRITMSGFSGAGGDHAHKADYTADADHPAVLCGEDHGPTPVEYALTALAACLTAGVANIAAARGVTLHEVTCEVAGTMDLRGILGLSDAVRNGFDGVSVTFAIKGDAPEEKLREIVEQSKARSAVFDVMTNPTPVSIAVQAVSMPAAA